MKKFFGMFFVMMMMSTVVCAANFIDTSGMECEYIVDRIAFLGIVNGTGGNKYEPEKVVTRAEFSKMITEIVAKDIGNKNNVFSDVAGHWGESYIAKASSLGILNGYYDGTFKPDNSVSYVEAIAIAMRCMGYTGLEENVEYIWYENYITKMKEIGLDKHLGAFKPTEAANRGDIAILLWNMISSEARVDEAKTMLKEYFPDFNYWDGEKVTEIANYNGKIVYVTAKGNFYVENDIDFSDFGGLVSGFYDSKNNAVVGMMIDEGLNYKKLAGSLKSMTEAGYEALLCDNTNGYGQQSNAAYVEIFIDEETNKVMRCVFYDTSESHFAEQIKIGDTRVTIDSRDVYDQSIVQLKNGQMITYNILRTESVMDISINAILVHDGEIVEWDSVPNDSVVREIAKNRIYTYTHRFIDGKLENGKVNYRTLIMNDKEFDVAESCVCQNNITNQTMKLKEGLTRKDIDKLGEVNDNVRVYLNEFDEIVKIEFNYDVWAIEDEVEKSAETHKEQEKQLKNIGFVTNVYVRKNNNGDVVGNSVKVLALPDMKTKTYDEGVSDFDIGVFVYLPSGETKIKAVSNKLEIGDMQVVMDYVYPITDNKIGSYTIGDNTQIVEVLLTKDENDATAYSKCTLIEKSIDQLYDYTKYKNVHLIVDEDGNVIRLYAIREIGRTINVGTVKDIQETVSGDIISDVKVFLYNQNKNTKRYYTTPVMGYSIGDLVTFEKISQGKEDDDSDEIVVKEVYRHGNIGSEYDLIVKNYNDGKVTFRNSDLVIEMNSDGFEYNGKVYNFDEYAFINVEVRKDKNTSEWIFKHFSITNSKNKFALNPGNRIAIDEITGTIIAYDGYRD